MRRHLTAPFFLSIMLSVLVGCVSPAGSEKPPSAQTGALAADETTPTAAALEAAPAALETPIPEGSVLPLLKAEFALRARDFELGSSLLTEQAVSYTHLRAHET